MKLFLASKASEPESMKRLDQFVGGLFNKKIAYIPTAANGERWESWKRSDGTWRELTDLKYKLDTILLEDFGDKTVVERIVENEIVWFGGGMLGYLLYWIRRCELDLYMTNILDKCIFVGSSAGSMIFGSNTTEIVSHDYVDNEKGANKIKPLEMFNFDVYPHYNEDLLGRIKRDYKGNKLYLIKNGEAVTVEDEKIKVLGEERIITNE